VIYKRPSADKAKAVISFAIPASLWADRVHLVGDFNGWDRESLPFRLNGWDDWQVEVELERGREYHFRYLIDGEDWRNDRHADLHTMGSDGILDSVVIAQLSPET
jgi:1,4-alpha-glucan branching enzyme